MSRLRWTLYAVAAAAGLLGASAGAGASGFALREFSASGQGNAFAGATAAAEDISTMAFNPAGLTRHPGESFAGAATLIVPRAEFMPSGATTILGGAIGGGNGGGDAAPDTVVPALFYARQLSSDWFAGASVTAPYGLVTDYDHGWVGRYHALKSDIRSINFNPVVAYKVTPHLSVAGGVQIAYTRGIMSNAIDFGTLDAVSFGGAFGGTPAGSDGTSTAEGDDLALGFNLGLLMEVRPGTRIGLAYRSKLHNRLDGATSFNNGTVGEAIAAATGAFVQTGMQTEINLPETASVGIYHEVTDRLAIMAEAAWTAWSRLRELRLTFDNAAQSDNVITSTWEDTWFLAVGATWRANDRWVLRTGIAYDQSPVQDALRTPRVPDEDRIWFSLGASYHISPGASLDIGYTRLFLDDAAIGLSATADPNNAFRGNLSGRFDLSTDILAVQYRVQF
jgi:long-chain fatty acid transport protein